ncbi:MAG: Holliday junction resolvase RuvX [Proteobacteria bacterium]|nr:Holliday junction resolvase RuvX [Pseudomonadota bacterium]
MIGLLKEILADRPKNTRLLGMDIGTKTIGLAICDPGQGIATPLKVIERTKFTKDIEQLKPLINDYNIGGYVLGYPYNMDGTEGPRCQAVRHFGQEMGNHPQIFGTNPWIALWDERLSTAAVDDFLVETIDMSRTKRKQVVDKLAAQYILQGAIDFIKMSAV